jgi:hypothetical protein
MMWFCLFVNLSHALLLADQLVDLIEYHIIEGLMPVPQDMYAVDVLPACSFVILPHHVLCCWQISWLI